MICDDADDREKNKSRLEGMTFIQASTVIGDVYQFGNGRHSLDLAECGKRSEQCHE